ncbi:MAG: hypothetical protein ABSF83_02015 [Nitrososphaerales archaeon]|jgi:hypothetical protein
MKTTGGRRYNSTLGKLLFVVPALVIIALVGYAFILLNSPGTLVVQAELAANGAQINVSAEVNGQSLTTPATISLPQGSYTADFGTIPWYYPPASRGVTITPGHTTYAVGSYEVKVQFVQVTPSGFNTTSVSVLHGLTPVTWKNPSNDLVTFQGGPFQQVRLDPGGSYTYVFPTTGTYVLNVGSTNETLDVVVK